MTKGKLDKGKKAMSGWQMAIWLKANGKMANGNGDSLHGKWKGERQNSGFV